MASVSDKPALRARMRALRRKLADECPEAARRLPAQLPSERIARERRIETYSLYHPMGSELDPGGLGFPGAQAALPVALARDAPLIFRAWTAGSRLVPDAFGIAAPGPESPEVAPDVVFAPVLAFDRRGGRLGQGAGHYDRTIANLRALKSVLVIGVAFAGQEVDETPLEPHDQRLDAIVTETGYIEVG